MKKRFWTGLVAALAIFAMAVPCVMADDIELAKKSTLEEIVKRGELRVGFEAGYLPFEMADKNGNFVGFDIDMAKAMADAMGVKFVPVNTAWDGIIPALVTKKFDIIISGMTVTQQRNLKINFADPYIIVGQTILLNKKHEGVVKSYKDLNDPKYVITSKLGTTGEQAIKRLIPKATYKSFEVEARSRPGSAERQSRRHGLRPALLRHLHGPARRRQTDLPGQTVYLRAAGLGHPQGRPGFHELAEQLPAPGEKRRPL
jgi:polar amino acid transport system substrate-binding protein